MWDFEPSDCGLVLLAVWRSPWYEAGKTDVAAPKASV